MKSAARSRAQVSLILRARRVLSGRAYESLTEAAQRVVTTYPPWSPAVDVARKILNPTNRNPWTTIEDALRLAKPRLVPPCSDD